MSADRLSISHRIYLGFGFLIVALLGLGSFAAFQFDDMAKSTETINEKITLVGGANDYALGLKDLSDSILLYAQSSQPDDRARVEEVLAEVKSIEVNFVEVLRRKERGEQADTIHQLSSVFLESLEPLLLRIENIGASADMILFGGEKLVTSGPDLAARLTKIATENPDYSSLALEAEKIAVAASGALSATMTYAIRPSEESLDKARMATALVDETLARLKAAMKGLPRKDRKVLKFLSRDNDLLKQGYIQFQGSNLGMLQSFTTFREAIEGAMSYAAAIRQAAIEEQNNTASQITEETAETIVKYSLIMIVIVTIAIFMGGITARSILGPLRRVTDDMKRLGKGNTDIDVKDQDRRDEVGTMAKAVVIFRQNALDVERLTQQRLDDQRFEEEKRSASLRAMADTIESETGVVLEKVATQTKELGTSVETMFKSAQHVSAQAQAAQKEAEASVMLAQNVSQAADHLSASIASVSEKVERQRDIAETAIDKAHRSAASVENLSEVAERIGGIVALISDIAAQTNMLSLNATIEAERAGAQGKGFAVVASEVKQLATQTAAATAEIREQIESVRGLTQHCVTSIAGVNGIIKDMAHISGDVAASVAEQKQATQQISESIQDSFAVSERLSGQVSTASEEMQNVGTLSTSLGTLSHKVGAMVESLQMSLNTAIRSAAQTSAEQQDASEPHILVPDRIRVVLRRGQEVHESALCDISNNGLALHPSLDLTMGESFKVEIDGIEGNYEIEVLSRRGLQSPKTRLRFVAPLEERSAIVRYVVRLWADYLRVDFQKADTPRLTVVNKTQDGAVPAQAA